MRQMAFVVAAVILGGCAPDPALQRLQDRQDVEDTVNKLFIHTDNRAWADIKACFADSVWFDMTSLVGGQPVTVTPQMIVDGWTQGLSPLKSLHHQSGNFLVTLDGHHATVFCYGTATHYLPNPSDRNTRSFIGSYEFRLIKGKSGWVIDRFKFNSKFLDGNLNLEAAAKTR